MWEAKTWKEQRYGDLNLKNCYWRYGSRDERQRWRHRRPRGGLSLNEYKMRVSIRKLKGREWNWLGGELTELNIKHRVTNLFLPVTTTTANPPPAYKRMGSSTICWTSEPGRLGPWASNIWAAVAVAVRLRWVPKLSAEGEYVSIYIIAEYPRLTQVVLNAGSKVQTWVFDIQAKARLVGLVRELHGRDTVNKKRIQHCGYERSRTWSNSKGRDSTVLDVEDLWRTEDWWVGCNRRRVKVRDGYGDIRAWGVAGKGSSPQSLVRLVDKSEQVWPQHVDRRH